MTAARVNAILDIGIALARLHNGGPNWRQKLAATDGYWAKVNGQ